MNKIKLFMGKKEGEKIIEDADVVAFVEEGL
jgi:hypothetical protein